MSNESEIRKVLVVFEGLLVFRQCSDIPLSALTVGMLHPALLLLS